jgi:adenylate kinase family enzyme
LIAVKQLIFGNSGSGKSTLAKAMAAHLQLAHLDLDSIVWEPEKIAVQRGPESSQLLLHEFINRHSSWVIEGCYGELIALAAVHCTQLVFLNPGLDACVANNLRRPWEPHKYASLVEQNSMLDALQAWVQDYYTRADDWSYVAHRRIFDSYQGAKTEHRAALSYDSIG